MGFWVPATKKIPSRAWSMPSMVTFRSSIAWRSADWVFGGVRLISSASRKLVKTGPFFRWKSAVRESKTNVPVTSEGIRSGVNCTRLKSQPSAVATIRTIRVLAIPGGPSRRTCPPGQK